MVYPPRAFVFPRRIDSERMSSRRPGAEIGNNIEMHLDPVVIKHLGDLIQNRC